IYTKAHPEPARLKYDAVTSSKYLSHGQKGSNDRIVFVIMHWRRRRSTRFPYTTLFRPEASSPSVSEITITKQMDSTSPKLAKERLEENAVALQLQPVVTGDKQLNRYLTINMTNTMISGYSFSSGGDRPSESLTLNFTKI